MERVIIEASGELCYFWVDCTLTGRPKAAGDEINKDSKSVFIVRFGVDKSWKVPRLMGKVTGNNRTLCLTSV